MLFRYLGSLLLLLMPLSGTVGAEQSATGSRLGIVWSASKLTQELKSWQISDLAQLKSTTSNEKDPVTGKIQRYKGVLLSTLLDQAMESLPNDRRAQVDLLVLYNALGQKTLLPRSVVTKYPVLVALQSGKASVVMPWTSKPKINQESLHISSLFVPQLSQIELSSYQERFSTWFLKSRRDPVSVRGERLYLQNCVGCHSSPVDGSKLSEAAHPAGAEVSKVGDRERRAIMSYLLAYRSEQALQSTSQTGGSQASSQ